MRSSKLEVVCNGWLEDDQRASRATNRYTSKSMCNMAVTRNRCEHCWYQTNVITMRMLCFFLGTWHAVHAGQSQRERCSDTTGSLAWLRARVPLSDCPSVVDFLSTWLHPPCACQTFATIVDASGHRDPGLLCQLVHGVRLRELIGAHRDDGMLGAAFRARDLRKDVDVEAWQAVRLPVEARLACRRGVQHGIDLQVACMSNEFVVTDMATIM